MKVKNVGMGVFENECGMHFTSDNDENIVCMETGELMKITGYDEMGNIIEIDYLTETDVAVEMIFNEAMEKRQPCKSLIQEIIEGADIDDEDDGF